MRGNTISYILLIVLVLLVFGVISLGDVLSVLFYIVMGIAILVLLGFLVLRYRILRIRREMERQGGDPNASYRAGNRPRASRDSQNRREGEVTVERTKVSVSKKTRNEVGDYVEYEEIEMTEDKGGE